MGRKDLKFVFCVLCSWKRKSSVVNDNLIGAYFYVYLILNVLSFSAPIRTQFSCFEHFHF